MTEAQGSASMPEQARGSMTEAQGSMTQAQQYACELCPFTTSSKKGLAGHMRLGHQRPVKEDPLGDHLDEIMGALDSRLGKLTEEVTRMAAVAAESSKPKLLCCPDGKCGFATDEVDRYVDHRLKTVVVNLMEELNKKISSPEHLNAVWEYVHPKIFDDGHLSLIADLTEKVVEKKLANHEEEKKHAEQEARETKVNRYRLP